MSKRAMVTGASGMDGSLLCELLLRKGYNVLAVIRRNATGDLGNIHHLEGMIEIEEGDITDMSSMVRLISSFKPAMIFNMAAMSHVATSFEQPLYTFEANTKGVINILEAVRTLDPSIKVFHASTSEMFGNSPAPQNQDSLFVPQSPYAIAKIASHYFVRLYREAYGLFCCSGMTFNHEHYRRGPKFLTRKVSLGVAQVLKDPSFKLRLGFLDTKRDWGWAPEYVDGFLKAMLHHKPNDYIFATGETHSVQEFCEEAFSVVGLDWKNHVVQDKKYERPAEVYELRGDYSLTQKELGWEPKVRFKELVKRMVEFDCYQVEIKD
jgi:GDPmannose 4,6-dehydratase